jgi:hypothetical protein
VGFKKRVPGGPPPGSKNAAQTAAQHEKDEKAWSLSLTGASYSQIAKLLGYADGSGACKAVKRVIERMQVTRLNKDEKIAQSKARLERLLFAIAPMTQATPANPQTGAGARSPDLKAVARAESINMNIAKLEGLLKDIVELTGENGGPLTTVGATVDWSTIQAIMEKNKATE